MTFVSETCDAETSSRLAGYFDKAQVGLHIVGGDGTILLANRADCAPIEVARDDYVGRSITDFHADLAVIGDMLERLLTNRPLINYTAILKADRGPEVPVVICSNSRWSGATFVNTRCYTRALAPRAAVAPVAEVAARAAADSELCATLGDFFEQSIPGVCAIDDDGRIVAINRSLAGDLGADQSAFLGKAMTGLIATSDGAATLGDLQAGRSLIDHPIALAGTDGPLSRQLYATADLAGGRFAGTCLFFFDPQATDGASDRFTWPGDEES